MNRDYLLSVGVAAAVHGVLLFGFTKPSLALSPPAEPSTKHVFEVRLEPEPEEGVVAAEGEARRDSSPPVEPPPRSAEPVLREDVVPAVHQVVVPPPPRVNPGDVTRIAGFDTGLNGKPGDGSWWGNVVPSNLLDKVPRARFQGAPVYPFEAKRNGVRGEVHVDFTVDERGEVVAATIVRSSDAVFNEPTLRAVLRWRFEPGRRDGKIVRFRMMVPVVFSLNEDGR